LQLCNKLYAAKKKALKYIKNILFNLLLISSTCYGQNNLYQFIHLNNEDGLSQNSVTSICQDQYGFIWLATFNGLNRYDGYNFHTFLNDDADSTSLSYNDIEVLFNDSKGRLWVGTFGRGINVFNHKSQKFKRYFVNSTDSNSISSNEITDIFENPKGTIWIATQYGLNRYNEGKDNFTRYLHNLEDPTSILSNAITCLHSNNPSHLWIGTEGGGLCKLDIQTNRVTSFTKSQGNTIKDDIIYSLYENTGGKLYIGGDKKALTVYDQNKNTFKYYGYSESELTNQGENLVRTIAPGLGDDLWIGSDGGGLYQLNHTLGYFREYKYNITKKNGVATNSITHLYKDNHDLIWIGLIDHGVDRINLQQKKFYQLNYDQDPKKGLKNNGVTAFMKDSEGIYWIGTDGGLTVSNDNLDSFTHFNERFNDYSTINNNAVVTIKELKNGEIWIGTYLGGVNIYNKKTKKFRYLISEIDNPNSLSHSFVRAIYEYNDSLVWIGTMGGGLNIYNTRTNKFTHHLTAESGHEKIKSDFITSIIDDKAGNIYIALFGGGLIVFNKSSVKFNSFTYNSKNGNSISNDQIISLFIDSDSTLWVGTANGLNAFNTKTKTFTKFFKTNGLSDNFISTIAEDADKNLWIGTTNGITKLNIRNYETKCYYKEDGLQGKEFNLNASYASNDGMLYFGGYNGITYFNPDSIIDHILEPEIQFTELHILGQPIGLGDTVNNRVVLKEPIYKTKKLTLCYKEPIFTLFFSGFLFNSVDKTRYAYRLAGTNSDWIDLGTSNKITFHKFPYGKHNLEIRATNSEGKWSNQTKSILINYKPPFWKTWLFLSFLILILVILLVLLYNWRTRRIKNQRALLEKMVREKTKDLQEINLLLEEKHAEMEIQQELILSQRDLAHDQNLRILKQNEELGMHRKHLENLVDERTKDLIEAKLHAEKADELKSAFLANMSHEIRTPMNAILGFIELLDYEGYSIEQRKYFKKIINDSGHTLLGLIDDIIDIAKIESGQISVNLSSFRLKSIFEDLNLIYTKKAAEEKPEVLLILSSIPEVDMVSDKLRVNQVMINLIDNALKFTEKGTINFGYEIKNHKILCFVKDTGMGISIENQEIVFDRFRKIENKNSKLFRGAGLGLAISKHIIELLGGTIWVESELGVGSTFYFTLPYSHSDN
jgi:signal transduction histidine kinase/ligand-binding sensor domain-containing protein